MSDETEVDTEDKARAKKWMMDTLFEAHESGDDNDYFDCGEIQCTALAENCADEYDLMDDDGDIEEWVLELAVDVAEEFEDELASVKEDE